MRLPKFEYYEPKDLKEAVSILRNEPSAKILAGGTDLLVNMKHRVECPPTIVNIKRIDGLDNILHRVNKELSMNNDSFMFVTAFCGILNINTGEVRYVNAGHNPPLIIRQGKEAEYLVGPKGTALGIDEESIYQEANLIMHTGDTLFMYTDGVTEAFNTNKEQFSEERLQKEVDIHQTDAIEDMAMSILDQVQEFSGEMPQTDDITILALKYS